jgi:protein SCO1
MGMKTFKKELSRSPWLNYAILGALIVGLFLAGISLGSAVFASPSGSAAEAGSAPSGGALVNPPFKIHDFALTNHTGALASMKDLRGRAVVLFFGYTHCPDVCPTTLADFKLVKESLGAEADRVTFVFVTVDSERDTPVVLKEYLSRFDTGFVGLTGNETTLRSMAAEYGAYFDALAGKEKDHEHKHDHAEGINTGNYFVQHTSPAYLIDPQGFLRVVYFNGTAPEVIAQGIRQILKGAS